jgi:uncharacterized SAM-binding protein YcdF (DUF218 family)
MRAIAAVVKAALIPGSVSFLLLGLGLGVVLLYARTNAAVWGRTWLAGLLALYWLLSLPVFASVLIQGLQGDYGTIQTTKEAKGARLVFLVGNGTVSYSARGFALDQLTRRTAFCVFEAARLYRLIEPAWIVASGGIADAATQSKPESEMMRDELVRLGVPANRILLESESRSTVQQVANVADMIRLKQLSEPMVLVTTPAHIRRVMLLMVRHGLDVVPSVTADLRYDRGQIGWRRWRPSGEALRGSESAMYEYLAFAYAWMRR